MVNPVILVGGVLFALITYAVLYIRIYNKKKLELIDWFMLSLATFNGLGFSFVFWATNNGMNSSFWNQYISMYDNQTAVMYLLSSIILSLSTAFGWKIFKSLKPSKLINEKNMSGAYTIRIIKKVKLVAWIMLILGVFSYALYANAYGGFLGLLNYSIAIRSGIMSINNPFSFLQRFGSFAFFSSFIFFGLIIDKTIDKKHIKRCFWGFILSLSFSIYVLYSWAGRVGALIYLATFMLGYLLHNYKTVTKLIRKLIILGVSLPLVLLGIDSLLSRSSSSIGITELFAKELSFPLASYVVQFGQDNYRFFKDIVVAPLFLLPQRIWSVMLNIEVASSYNTFVFFGARKGEAGVTGSIPVDMLTFANMQASIFGVVVVGLLWGALIYYLEIFVRKINPIGVRKVIYSNMILNIALLTVLYGDPQHIVIRNFAMIIGLILMTVVTKFKLGFQR
jgi:hypothetical protein